MAERSVSTSWKTKRRQRQSTARLRELKRAKLSSTSAAPGSSSSSNPASSDPSSTSTPPGSSLPSSDPSTSTAPGSSSSDPSTFGTGDRPGDEDDNSEHSESENERNLSGSSSEDDDDSPFDGEKAQAIFDDWVIGLPLNGRRMLAVMLMETVQKRFNVKSTAAALEAAWITGFNEKTVRKYRKEFYENRGKFKDEARGKYKRFCLFNEESLRLQASMWIRENAVKKGAPNLVARSFCQWVNNELLPSSDLPPNLPRSISVRTATRWLHRMGFRPTGHKKGTYVDGHERDDVVAYRQKFLDEVKALRESHLPPPPPSDERAPTPPIDAESRKRLVLIYHDESIFNTNEGQKWAWATGDEPIIQPKTKGAGIMVSDFIEQHDGFLKIPEFQAQHAGLPSTARVLLEYGAEKDGYWNSERFIRNVEDALKIAEFKYPPRRNTLVFIFDQSSCHRAYAENALNASRMNVRPGGKQPVMRDTVWGGHVQKMVNDSGVPKGMKAVLEERGVNTERMKADDMRTVLSFHDDFVKEQTMVEKLITSKGHKCIYLPKFHCELNPIERVWGQAKVYSRAHTNFTLVGLRAIIHPALDSVSTDLMRKYFRRVHEYERAYQEGKKAGKELEAAVKVYKSHRRIFFES